MTTITLCHFKCKNDSILGHKWQLQDLTLKIKSHLFTFCCSDLTGLLSVSVKCKFFGNLGLEDGVWMAQHLMKMAIKMTKAIPISRTAHQCWVTHCIIVKKVSWLKSRFFKRTSGPSASTLRHLRNTSQYPEKHKYLTIRYCFGLFWLFWVF